MILIKDLFKIQPSLFYNPRYGAKSLQHKENMTKTDVQRAEPLCLNNVGMPDNLNLVKASFPGFSMDESFHIKNFEGN